MATEALAIIKRVIVASKVTLITERHDPDDDAEHFLTTECRKGGKITVINFLENGEIAHSNIHRHYDLPSQVLRALLDQKLTSKIFTVSYEIAGVDRTIRKIRIKVLPYCH